MAPCVRLTMLVASTLLVAPCGARGEPVAVRHREGRLHGFLVLKTSGGSRLADGELLQTARGDRVTSRLVFRFDDGSVYDETTEYLQRRTFRLASDRLNQKGPSFPTPLEMFIDAEHGQVSVRYTDEDGRAREASRQLDLPPDLANGLIPVLLANVDAAAPPASFSYVAATPQPRLVKLRIRAEGETTFFVGEATRRATHYVLKADLGGLAGLLAPLVGKQPPDAHVWIAGGAAPAFVRAAEPLYVGGPVWRIELASPVWHETETAGQPPRAAVSCQLR